MTCVFQQFQMSPKQQLGSSSPRRAASSGRFFGQAFNSTPLSESHLRFSVNVLSGVQQPVHSTTHQSDINVREERLTSLHSGVEHWTAQKGHFTAQSGNSTVHARRHAVVLNIAV